MKEMLKRMLLVLESFYFILPPSAFILLLYYDVDEALWHDDDFDNLAARCKAAYLFIGERGGAQLFFGRLGRGVNAPAQLAVDLHGNLQLFFACQLFVRPGPTRGPSAQETARVAQPLPHLFADMRRERREHDRSEEPTSEPRAAYVGSE